MSNLQSTQDVVKLEVENTETITYHNIDKITYRIRSRSSENATQSLFQMLSESISREIAKKA
jgi:hypothetical protein